MQRPKTGVNRRCSLSPELVADLEKWRKRRDARHIPFNADLVFTTRQGHPYRREIAPDNAKGAVKVRDSISKAFDRLIRWTIKIKTARDGRSFYTLRRTHRTWTDELGDVRAADRVMGHQSPDMGGVYVQTIGDERLRRINEHVMGKLKQTQSPSPTPPPTADDEPGEQSDCDTETHLDRRRKPAK